MPSEREEFIPVYKPTSLFIELLALMFIYLKLTNQIDWPWIQVTAPLWLGILLVGVRTLILRIKNKYFF